MGDMSGFGTAVLLIFTIVAFLVWFIRVLTSHRPQREDDAPVPTGRPDKRSLDIAKAVLDAEYARGQISRAEHKRRLRNLRQT